jgi:hypothetical protein
VSHLPTPRAVVRHSWPHVIEGSVVPFAVFAVVVRTTGALPAVLAAFGWSVLALVRRLWRRHRVSGILILGTITLAVRTLVAVTSGNLALYFIPPLLTSLAVAVAFVVSASCGRPLSWRLANDLHPLPPHALHDPGAGPVFARLCWLWGGIYASKAIVNLWLYHALSLESFAMARGPVSFLLIGGGIALSYRWVRQALHNLPAAPALPALA